MPVAPIARTHHTVFTPEFLRWIPLNEHMYDVFEGLADQLWAAGRTHYSARTIGEKMRFDHGVRALGDKYKLRNAFTGDLGRLYMIIHPTRVDLFSYHKMRNGVDFRQYMKTNFGV